MATALEKAERVLVVGLGISGRSAAESLLREGKRVTVNDISTTGEIEAAAAELRAKGAEAALGHHRLDLLDGTDLVVVSPGVRSRLPLLSEAEKRGIPVWSEIELAWRYARGPLVAVTGTNGKTTTVSMIAWILQQAGRKAVAAGNIGYPLIRAVEDAGAEEILVVEVSSFQLVYTEEFRPRVAVLLNIAEDHLDWHLDMEDYVRAKARLWENQERDDLAVCNLDDPRCVKAARGAPSRVLFFSRRPDPAASVFLEEGMIISRMGGAAEEVMAAGELPLPGAHNLENAMAAAAAAISLELRPRQVGEALSSFRSLDHRLQLVGESGGIAFYDDSKATNPHAAESAIAAFDRPLVIILGGRNKGLSFDGMAAGIERKRSEGGVRAAYLIGEAAREIEEALGRFSPRLPRKILPGLEEVFEDLAAVAREGDAVLFSPACASFDRYRDYRERGRHYQDMVRDYCERGGGRG